MSTIIEEKNLEEQEIQKLSSSLVVEETTKEISEEEEIYGVILKEEVSLHTISEILFSLDDFIILLFYKCQFTNSYP